MHSRNNNIVRTYYVIYRDSNGVELKFRCIATNKREARNKAYGSLGILKKDVIKVIEEDSISF